MCIGTGFLCKIGNGTLVSFGRGPLYILRVGLVGACVWPHNTCCSLPSAGCVWCRMLDDMSHEAESTDSRLKALTARVDKVSKKMGG